MKLSMIKLWVLLLMLSFSLNSHAEGKPFGIVHDIHGAAYVSDRAEKNVLIRVGEEIYEGQTIETAENSEVHITSTDGGLIALRPDTEFRVDAYSAEGESTDKVHMSLIKGSLRSVTGWIPKHHSEAYQVSALSVTIGVRGTDHEITIVTEGEEAGIHNAVYHGATILKNAAGEVHVPTGHFAFASHAADTKPTLLNGKPTFHTKSLLYKIEHKFEQRKLELESKLEQLREEWLEKLSKMRSESLNR